MCCNRPGVTDSRGLAVRRSRRCPRRTPRHILAHRVLALVMGSVVLGALTGRTAHADPVAEPVNTRPATQPDRARIELVPLKIDPPDSAFTDWGLMSHHLSDGVKLDPRRARDISQNETPRNPLMVPKGATTNVARGKPVTASVEDPFLGSVDVVTDGEKRGAIEGVLEMRPGARWVQIDLKQPYRVYAVVIWHYPTSRRVYRDVVIRLTRNKEFDKSDATVFNNDGDNSLGLGKGEDFEYIENTDGRVIGVNGVVGRYVRCYSNENNANAMNHYVEVEVYGMPLHGDKSAATRPSTRRQGAATSPVE